MSFECREEEGGECEEAGIGNDEAVLHFHYFKRPGSPQSKEDFIARLNEISRSEFREVSYAWDDWEFQPSLNYRGTCMDLDGDISVWKINDVPGNSDDDNLQQHDEESDIEIELSAEETIWVVNYCPTCYKLFHSTQLDKVCKLHLAEIAKKHGLNTPEPTLDQIRETVKML